MATLAKYDFTMVNGGKNFKDYVAPVSAHVVAAEYSCKEVYYFRETNEFL